METLEKIITTLNLIEVSGKDNMNRLLGCIIALESLVDSLKSQVSANPDILPDPADLPHVDAEKVE